eukprot:GHVU01074943.1.p2 GENE.GHVU01074943.1~~GHVU01074943.1.p2  ORF type:complete len:242 (+),score=7.34 GHVU01074943.1:179-904(+)
MLSMPGARLLPLSTRRTAVLQEVPARGCASRSELTVPVCLRAHAEALHPGSPPPGCARAARATEVSVAGAVGSSNTAAQQSTSAPAAGVPMSVPPAPPRQDALLGSLLVGDSSLQSAPSRLVGTVQGTPPRNATGDAQRDRDAGEPSQDAPPTPSRTPAPQPVSPRRTAVPQSVRGPCPCVEHGCFERGLAVEHADAAPTGATGPPPQRGPATRARRGAEGQSVQPTLPPARKPKRPRWKG